MTFTLPGLARSLADYLSPVLPGVTFYEDPNQQGSEMPCAFLQQRYAYIELRPGRRWLRRIGLDLTCLEDYHLPGLQRRYQAAAEALDLRAGVADRRRCFTLQVRASGVCLPAGGTGADGAYGLSRGGPR